MRRLLLLLVALSLTVTSAACGSVTPYAAKVNDDTITERDLDRELDAILGNRRYLDSLEQSQIPVRGKGQGTFDMAFVSRILTRQIFLTLVHQEVERRKLEISDADRQRAESDVAQTFEDAEVYQSFPEEYRDLLVTRTAEVTELQTALAEVDVSDAAVKQFYDQNKQDFGETCVAHILVDDAAQAAATKQRIAAGEDFAAVARATSKDPGSAPRGGDLGCVTPGNFVPEFETTMERLPPGQVSDPVQTQFGFHLILVRERRAKPLAEVADEIRQRLLSGGQAEFNAFLRGALEESDISVNPRYGRFVKTGQQPGVVPPTVPQVKGDTDEVPPLPGGVPGAPPDTPQGE